MAQVNDPQKLFEYKLGTALALERKVEKMLRMMEDKASMDQLKQGFARHREETGQQIKNIEQAIQAVGGDSTAHQDPIIEGIEQQAEQMLGRVDEQLVDAVLAGGAAHTEHHEIATYEGLITMASAMGQEDVVALLQENLEQEQKTLREVESVTETLSQQLAQTASA
jgi:ferritin-like metal-binding protein YciE